MVGCESGTILSCNRKAKNPSDRVAGAFHGHHGPVYGLKRHPFAAKYFLSVGDWTARIWAEDSKQPLITTRYHSTYLTGAFGRQIWQCACLNVQWCRPDSAPSCHRQATVVEHTTKQASVLNNILVETQ